MPAIVKEVLLEIGGVLLILIAFGLGLLAGQSLSGWLLGFIK